MLMNSLCVRNIFWTLTILSLAACGSGTSVAVEGDDPIDAFLAAKEQQGDDFDPDKALIVLTKPDGVSPNVDAEVFETVGEPGFVAVDLQDGDITSSVDVINLVPEECQDAGLRDPDLNCLNEEGFRKIYSVVNSRGKQTTIARFYRFQDLQSPQINFDSSFPSSVERTQDLPDVSGFVSAEDNYDLSSIEVSLLNPDASTDSVGSLGLQFRATDSSGNSIVEQRSIEVIDTVDPLVTITSPAESFRTQSAVLVSGTCESSPGNSGVEISGDVSSTVTVDCIAGTFAYPMELQNDNTLNVATASQFDQSGNLGEATPRSFFKDNLEPNLSVTSPSNGESFQEEFDLVLSCETFEGSAAYPNSNIVVSGPGIDADYNLPCDGGALTIADVPLTAGEGSKSFSVLQSDFAGNQKVIQMTLERDNSGPLVSILDPEEPNKSFRNGPGTNDLFLSGRCERGVEFDSRYVEARLERNESGITSWASINCSENGDPGPDDDTFTGSLSLSGVSESGVDTFLVVRQRDDAEIVSEDQILVIVDNTAPDLELDDLDEFTSSTSLTITGACEATDVPGSIYDNGQVRAFGSGVEGDFLTDCAADNRFSLNIELTASQGVKSIQVSQSDFAGNQAADSDTIVLDSEAPEVTILSPLVETPVMSGALVAVEGACSSGDGDVLVGIDFANEQSVSCSSGQFQSQVTIPAGTTGEPVNLTARQSDASGQSGEDERVVRIDNTPPALGFDAIDPVTSLRNISVSGDCEYGSDPFFSEDVVLTGPFSQSGNSFACSPDGRFSASLNLTGPDGEKTIVANQNDFAGNAADPAELMVELDQTGPEISFSEPLASQPIKPLTEFFAKGQCSEDDEDVRIEVEGVAGETSASCSVFKSTGIQIQIADGTQGEQITITAHHSDAIGNPSSAEVVVVRDKVVPLSLNALPDPVQVTEIEISGTCEKSSGAFPAGNVSLAGGDIVDMEFACPADGSFEAVTLEFDTENGDGKSFSLSQTDFAGNTENLVIEFNYAGDAPVINVTYYKNGVEAGSFGSDGSPHNLGSEELCSDLDFVATMSTGEEVALDITVGGDSIGSDPSLVSKIQADMQLSFTADTVPLTEPVVLDIQIADLPSRDFDFGFKEADDWGWLENTSVNSNGSKIILCNSIDFAGSQIDRIGRILSAEIDGQGPDGAIKSLQNFVMMGAQSLALFREIGANGIVRNLSIRDFHIAANPGGMRDAAALAVVNKGLIERVKVHGQSQGQPYHIQGSDESAGLVANLIEGGEIREAVVEGIVIQGSSDNNGALVAELNDGQISDSYSITNQVEGEADTGGLVGAALDSDSSVERSYALFNILTGGPDPTHFTRSLIGENDGSVVVTASYYNADQAYDDDAGTSSSRYGEGISEGSFALQSSFVGWNFDTVWAMDFDSPYLRFEDLIED